MQDLQHARVLIVDDEWFISMEMKDTLEDAGFDVIGVAGSAEEAVCMAEQHQPDLVLMDIRLRGNQDGVSAAMEICRRFGIRCIFVSAYADAATRKRGDVAAPLGWLSKPFSGLQLVAAVRSALQELG